jgi:carnitine-CoA ligase
MYSGLNDPGRWVLVSALREMAARQPDALWLQDSDGGTLTWGQAARDSLRAAGWLQRLGVERGDRVGVLLFNGCPFVTAWLGLGHLGATAVLLNTELRANFLRHQLNDAQVGCLVVDAELLSVVEALVGELPHLRKVIVVGTGATPSNGIPWQVLSWPDWEQEHDWDGPPPGPQEIACIMYTSGTSGPSKGVLMPHAHCTLYGIGTARCLQLTSADRFYICLPLFHANGLLLQLGATLLSGIPIFVRRRFSASKWLADIREHGATVSFLLGATAGFIIAQSPTPEDRSHRLRALLTAPNMPLHEKEFRERFGIADIVSGFGMTEVNLPIWGRLGHSAPGAAGWAHEEHFEVCIADPETDAPLPPGQMGEILVRPRVPFGFMAGYFNAPEKTVEAWRNLWFHTGDAGVMREDGLVTFVDRIKDCIRRRGENISAAEVEEVVSALPGVKEVAAYAVPSDVLGGEDEVMLSVVPVDGIVLDPDEIAREAGERLPRFAQPRYVKLLDNLPKTATGKVQRALLRRQGITDAIDALKVS